jgi:glycosyltransferase involved in cell wall biosynthesis
MEKIKSKLCIILASDPNFLGGLGVYQKNLIYYLKNNFEITFVYKGDKDKKITEKDVTFYQIKAPKLDFLGNFIFESKVRSFLKKNKFDIINSHGLSGLWMNFFKKEKNTQLVHTYHGSTYHFYKNHLKRFGIIKRILFSPILLFPYFIEGVPMKKADKIICVSEHVKKNLISLHGNRKNMEVIRTGVDINIFKQRNKKEIKKILNLNQNNIYGLYVGRGGFWTKGLDKVSNLSKKIYELNKNFKLIIIGAEENKVKHLIDNRFMILLPPQTREKIPFYYNAANIFFSMSRCEGGAPTMVTSEAMASGCLIITDKEANQEIIEDEKNGLIIEGNYEKEAGRIIKIIENKKKIEEIIGNSLKSIKELSLEKWASRYLKFLIGER